MIRLSVIGQFKKPYRFLPLTNIWLFLSTIILDVILIMHGQTNRNDFAIIYICLFAVVFFLSHSFSYEKVATTPIGKDIVFLWILMLLVISFEYSIIIFGNNVSSLQYSSFVHLMIKCIGLFSSFLCFLCLFIKKHLSVYQKFIFLFSFTILASSVCIFFFFHDPFLDRTLNFWWVKYCLLEGGIILVGSLGAVCFSLLAKHYNKI